MSENTSARDIIDNALEGATPYILDEGETYAMPGDDGQKVVVSLEALRHTPDSTRGVYQPATVGALVEYVTEFKGAKSSVWVHPTEGKVIAILDDNAPGEAGWGRHRAELSLITTPEWEFWVEDTGTLLEQQQFAEKIEDGLGDIETPDGAEMLEIVQSIQTKTDVQFRSKIDLGSGEVRFAYDEDQAATAGKAGTLAIPAEFTLAIAPFVGEDPFRITARFRYRATGGNLRLGYKLERTDEAIRTVLDGIADRLRKSFDRVFIGTPADQRSPLATPSRHGF